MFFIRRKQNKMSLNDETDFSLFKKISPCYDDLDDVYKVDFELKNGSFVTACSNGIEIKNYKNKPTNISDNELSLILKAKSEL